MAVNKRRMFTQKKKRPGKFQTVGEQTRSFKHADLPYN